MKTLKIVSVCRGLPTPSDPSEGIFVLRRLQAMQAMADIRIVQPIPYFPVLRPLPAWARSDSHTSAGSIIRHRPMFYIPKMLKSLDGYWMNRSLTAELRRARDRKEKLIIDAHFGYPEGVGAVTVGGRLGLPVFVTFRGFEAEYILKPGIGDQIRRSLQRMSGCICVSHYLRNIVVDHGADPNKVAVVHNAIDRRTFNPGPREDARRELGLPQGERLVVSVGHLSSRKRHHVLIDAFAGVRERFGNARLAIIGSGVLGQSYPRQLEAQVARLGLQDAVRFVGNVEPDAIVTWLRAANVFALATQREGCCNAVLEALAVGLPVVTTPVGDNTHFVKDGDNGFIVPVDDAVQLSTAIAGTLSREDWDADRISNSLQVGSWSQVATQVIDFFVERIQDIGES